MRAGQPDRAHLYWNGLVSLDGDDLLDRYYRTTSDDTLGKLSGEIVAGLRDDHPVEAGDGGSGGPVHSGWAATDVTWRGRAG
ncbi:hypothetical protein ACFXDE_34515 [Kitasatospora sp. NPDC059408]|uniref:hypothetical protein n=1 Tax=Kitasatospora sp. NPDC059408 TaxID=3346823 RepID=UPI00369E5D2D